jgi:hypothetical protein
MDLQAERSGPQVPCCEAKATSTATKAAGLLVALFESDV